MAWNYLLLNKKIAPNLSYDSITRGGSITAVENPQPGNPIPIVWGTGWVEPYTAWYYYSHLQWALPNSRGYNPRDGTPQFPWVYTRTVPGHADALAFYLRQFIFSARMILCRGEIDRVVAVLVSDRAISITYLNAEQTTFVVSAPFFLGGQIGDDGSGGLGAFYHRTPDSQWGIVHIESDSKASTLRSKRDGTSLAYNQYRGLTSLSFPAFNFGGGDTLPAWRVAVERIDKQLNGSPQWYPSTAEPALVFSRAEDEFSKLRIFFVIDALSEEMRMTQIVHGVLMRSRLSIANEAMIKLIFELTSPTLPLEEIQIHIFYLGLSSVVGTWRPNQSAAERQTLLNTLNTHVRAADAATVGQERNIQHAMSYVRGIMNGAITIKQSGYRNVVVTMSGDLTGATNLSGARINVESLMNDSPYVGDYKLDFHAISIHFKDPQNLPYFDSDGVVPNWQASDEYRALRREIFPAIHVANTINPVHVLREIMTDNSFDFRYAISDLDDASWKAAAQRVYNERWGFSLAWDGKDSRQLAQSILDYVDGEIYFDAATNKLKFYLIRGDDTARDIPTSIIRSVSNVKLTDPRARPNTVTVTYTDAHRGEEDSVTVQDIVAVTANNGAKVEVNVTYAGCPSRQLASRAAARDLASLASSGLSFDISVVSTDNLHRGQLLNVELIDLDIPSTRMRIADISDDADREGGAVLSLVEDGVEYDTARVAASFIGHEPPFIPLPPTTPPELTPELFLYEASLPHVLKSGVTLANIKRAVAADVTSAMLAWATGVTPWVSPSVSTPTRPALKMANVGRLQSAISISQRSSVIAILNQNIAYTVDFTDRRTWLLLIGEGETQEVVRIAGIIQTRAGVTLMRAELHGRGLWDTVNHAHAAGSPVIAIGDMHVENSAYNTATSPLMFRATVSSNAITTEVSETFTPSLNRLHRPLPPAYFDGRYPRTFGDYTGAITLTWQNRSRDMTWQQLSYHDMTPRTLETNQVTRVRIMKDSTVLHTITTALETTTISVATMLTVANTVSTGARQLTGVRFVVDSVRDGVYSWQRWEMPFAWRADTTVPKTGWGENWGDDWDGA